MIERPKKQESAPSSFSVEEAIKSFKPQDGSPIEYLGTSMSSFQSEPVIYDAAGNPRILSDWDIEVAKSGEKDVPQFSKHAQEYVDRAAEIGNNMYRISLEFPRLCPTVGEFDEEYMGRYVETLGLIKARGMEPFVTLQHFTMPAFLLKTSEDGGITEGAWSNPDVAKHFRFYVERVARFLADDDKVRASLTHANLEKDAQEQILDEGLVRYFMSINEPATMLLNGYVTGVFPPHKKLSPKALGALSNMAEAHHAAYDTLKEELDENATRVGAGYNWQHYTGPGAPLMRFAEHFATDKFEKGDASDFLGLQYYMRIAMPPMPGSGPRDASDHPAMQDIYPKGIKDTLHALTERYPHKEVFVSEFGFSDKNDIRRPYWMLETMRYILDAKRAGVPVKGMLLWTLVNNLEWEQGTSQKFGLFNEEELGQPLVPSTNGIRTWEAWRAAVGALQNPSEASLKELETCYATAYAQYRANGGVY